MEIEVQRLYTFFKGGAVFENQIKPVRHIKIHKLYVCDRDKELTFENMRLLHVFVCMVCVPHYGFFWRLQTKGLLVKKSIMMYAKSLLLFHGQINTLLFLRMVNTNTHTLYNTAYPSSTYLFVLSYLNIMIN